MQRLHFKIRYKYNKLKYINEIWEKISKILIFFIYDPKNKTVDRNHFFDLQGKTKKMDETGEYEFEVITILEK